MVFGAVPPSTFQFTTVVTRDEEPSGWQVAQVVVLLGRLSLMFPRAAMCYVEVGVPLIHHAGPVTVEEAQFKSAAAADAAAHKILKQHEKPTSTICDLFRKTMGKQLGHPRYGTIPGAKVTGFRAWHGKKVPRSTFPPRRGRAPR